MRVGQIWQWIYFWGVRDFAAMTNLGKAYTGRSGRAISVIEIPEVVRRDVSADGTRKYLVRIAGGHEVEVVYIPGKIAARCDILQPGGLYPDLFVLYTTGTQKTGAQTSPRARSSAR